MPPTTRVKCARRCSRASRSNAGSGKSASKDTGRSLDAIVRSKNSCSIERSTVSVSWSAVIGSAVARASGVRAERVRSCQGRVRRAGAAAGALSRTTWALVPPSPKEFTPARRLREDASWLPQAAGRAVKIVAQLLPNLPTGPQYRVVFMRRNLDEILASQDVMLRRHDRAGANLRPETLRAVFVAQIDEVERALASRSGINTLALEYRDAVQSPVAAAARINAFLGGALDEAAKAAVVDPTLWRQRA